MNLYRSKYLWIVVFFLFFTTILFAEERNLVKKYKKQYWYLEQYSPCGSIYFKVKENHKYIFKTSLLDKQYVFMCEAVFPFTFNLIEPSGNILEGENSYNGQLIYFENIMDAGEYTIQVFSLVSNEIYIEWGYYSE